MTVSGSLVQVNGAQRSFQAAMKRSIPVMRSATVGKLPRRRAWRVMISRNAYHQVQPRPRGRGEVQLHPGMTLEPGAHVRVLVGRQVIDHDVQLAAR
jgi:hypothetical protein